MKGKVIPRLARRSGLRDVCPTAPTYRTSKHIVARILLCSVFGTGITAIGLADRSIAAETSSPTAFVQNIYAHYSRGLDLSWHPWDAPTDATVYEPQLLRVLRLDRRLTAGEVNSWDDGDWFCECQDSSGITPEIRLESGTATTARVSVDIAAPGHPPQILHFALVRIASQWRIADMTSSAGKSFKAAVMADVRQNQTSQQHPH